MLQEPALLIAATIAAFVMVGFTFVFFRLRAAQSGRVSASGRAIGLRPMARLLQKEDFAFLSEQKGYRGEIGKTLRRRRVTIFRGYLGHLKTEFHSLHQKLRLVALYSDHDREDLSKLLVEQRFLFMVGMLKIEVRLALFQFGMEPADVSGLVNLVENMRQQFAQISANLAPMPVST